MMIKTPNNPRQVALMQLPFPRCGRDIPQLLRIKRILSANKFARIIGVSHALVSRVEKWESSYQPEHFESMKNVLRLDSLEKEQLEWGMANPDRALIRGIIFEIHELVARVHLS